MKGIIKNILNESLGVPEGILESAERLYKMCFNRIVKITDPILNGTDEEKKFKRISEIMMKKLSKLYSMAKDEKSSIKNWDLHHKINRTNENIQSEYKFNRK